MYKYIGLLQESQWYDQSGLSDGFRLNGNSSIKFLAQFYGLKPPTTESLTIADYLTRSSFGEPRVGQRTVWERVELVVEEMQKGRISKVRIAILPLRERRGADGGDQALPDLRGWKDRRRPEQRDIYG